MEIKKLLVELEDGSQIESTKGFSVFVDGNGLDVRFLDMQSGELLQVLAEIQYEVMSMIKRAEAQAQTEQPQE